MLKLELTEAITTNDAEQMRLIRNSCRQFMTNNNKEISIEEQQTWWKKLDRNVMKPFLAEISSPSGVPQTDFIGYGIIKYKDDRLWLTGGLLPAFRGKGFGELLFRRLIDVAGIPCWVEVLESNLPARRLYEKLGFIDVSGKEKRLMLLS